jgi:hypothetical protein
LNDLDNLSRGTRAYFQQRQKNRLYNLVMSKFKAAQETDGLTRAKLARRMGRRPEVVTRWLRSPGNWRLDTLSDFLLAICGEEIDDSSSSPLARPARNYSANSSINPNNRVSAAPGPTPDLNEHLLPRAA